MNKFESACRDWVESNAYLYPERFSDMLWVFLLKIKCLCDEPEPINIPDAKFDLNPENVISATPHCTWYNSAWSSSAPLQPGTVSVWHAIEYIYRPDHEEYNAMSMEMAGVGRVH